MHVYNDVFELTRKKNYDIHCYLPEIDFNFNFF